MLIFFLFCAERKDGSFDSIHNVKKPFKNTPNHAKKTLQTIQKTLQTHQNNRQNHRFFFTASPNNVLCALNAPCRRALVRVQRRQRAPV